MAKSLSEPASRIPLILGCPCECFGDTDVVKARVGAMVESGKGGYSIAINAEKIQDGMTKGELRDVAEGVALAVPDGAGAVIGLRVLHGMRSLKVDFPRAVLELGDERGWELFVGGTMEEANALAVQTIATRYPNIRIVGRMHGYVSEEEMVEAVVRAKPKLMLLALGSPRQEQLAKKLIPLVPGLFVAGCGGALNILAGKLRRAPGFMVENNLEWLYRLYKEPWRWRRQLLLPRYLLRLLAVAARERFRVAPAKG